MISFDEAIDLVRSEIRPLGTEQVQLADAAGRIVAAPVVAQVDSPRTDVSAMDGYAVCEKDLECLPAILTIAGESFAGGGFGEPIERGTCIRIFTGAPVPDGADRVVIQEYVRKAGLQAIIDARPGAASHIRRRGSDFCAGDELLGPGRLLDPRAIVAAAAADHAGLQLFRQPRLLILSTGDELIAPGRARERATAIPESISFGLASLAAQWGALPRGSLRLQDDIAELTAAADAALDAADIIAVTGGASVGERDFAKAMFEPHGLELIFSKVAIKPGKPVWFGRARDRLIIGLPGNPTSAMVTARLFLAPLIAALTGRNIKQALNWRKVPLASPLAQGDARETFHRARFVNGSADILSFQQSAAQKALVEADVLVRQAANSNPFESGELVDVLDF